MSVCPSTAQPALTPDWIETAEPIQPVSLGLAVYLLSFGNIALYFVGLLFMMLAVLANLLSSDSFFDGGWLANWTRICLCLWVLAMCAAFADHRYNRPPHNSET